MDGTMLKLLINCTNINIVYVMYYITIKYNGYQCVQTTHE